MREPSVGGDANSAEVVRLRGRVEELEALLSVRRGERLERRSGVAAAGSASDTGPEAARLLQQALDAANAGTWRRILATGETFWSDETWRLYDLDRAVWTASFAAWNHSVHPDSIPTMNASAGAAMERGDPFEIEWRVNTRDGSVRWLLSRGLPERDETGNVVAYQGIVLDITERREADAKRRATEQRLEMIFEHSGTANALFDRDCRLTLQNSRSAAYLGAATDGPVGKTPLELFPGEQGPVVLERMRRVLSSGVAESFDTTFDLPVGRRVFRTAYQPIFDSQKVLQGVQLVSQDTTERHRAETDLRASEARYRSLFEHMVEGFAYCRMIFENGEPSDFVYLSVNAAFGKLTGLENVEGRRVTEVIPGIQKADSEVLRRYGRVARTGEPDRFEIYIASLEMWFDLSVYSPEKDHFVAVFDVITARKKAEAERERLLAAIEHAGEVILVTDPQGIIQYVNPAFETVSGYTAKEAIGQTPRLVKSGKQDVDFYRDLWRTIKSGQRWRGKLVNRRKDGGLYCEETVISPVTDATGEIVSFVAVKRDITAVQRLEEQLRVAQKMEAIGSLAGGVAHDFNNILSVILGYTTAAMEGMHERDPLLEDLREVKKAADRATGLTRQLLAFSRKQVLEPRILDVREVVLGMEKMLRRLIGEHIELNQVAPAALGLIKADPGQLEQVIMNLVVNARDAMPDGGTLTIEIAAVVVDEFLAAEQGGVARGPYVLLAVTDTGCGMDEATRSRIFEPFFTTKEKGTGLGLSTVYGIVKQSGGFITVESEAGKGTTFSTYLPTVAEAGASQLTARPPARAADGHETILLVEDDDSLRKIAVRQLRAVGYNVLAAAHPGEALLTSEQYPGEIDLLLTDVMMPQMKGRELAERVKKQRPTIHVVFMSGYTDDTALSQGILEHEARFISKPFTAADLAAKVRAALDDELG